MIHRNKSFPQLLLLIVLYSSFPASSGARLQASSPESVPFEMINNLIFIKVQVNNSKPLSFILDTGASGSVINASRAKELGLSLEGETEATTGGGSVEATFAKGVTLSLSGVVIPGLTLTAIGLNGLEAGLGQNVDGILGFEIFNRYVVEIDYISHAVKFYEPKHYRYTGTGSVVPITLTENTPFVRAKVVQQGIKAAEGNFLFNTGGTGALLISAPFAVRNKLSERASKALQITSGAILANQSTSRVARIKQLQLGDLVISGPFVNFSQNMQGTETGVDDDGFIGGEVLRRFKIIVDYSRGHVIVERNKDFSEPYEFDMSGMSLAAQGSDFKVFRVRTLIEKSPAAEAGLRVGDIILAINGKPAGSIDLPQIRHMFRQEGRRFSLSVKRDESLLTINIRTRKLI
jgi:hypothetical protein